MNDILINKYITSKRFAIYDTLELYDSNLKKAKQSYIPLSVLEVSLRNSINSLFERFYGAGWIVNEAQFLKHKEIEKIESAKDKIRKNREEITQDKLISELSFGFWTALFQSAYNDKMRTAYLKQIFPNLPPKNRELIDRKKISAKLNNIRKFRNRVFHHENIIKDEFVNIESEIYEILSYFDDEVCAFAKRVNNE
ncbi:Abi family protein [Sulfurimonas hydrogeniphila]|uniref:Abi family protein n=1 Tax=Sulfurimonas hydrogeniphila TaxID=2509341 RepID=UPI00125ECFC1|nr:Abi family protein [Sulfurimonas hydrogeniphila]